jgi:hypothetical protein
LGYIIINPLLQLTGYELAFDHFDIRFLIEFEMPMSDPQPVVEALHIGKFLNPEFNGRCRRTGRLGTNMQGGGHHGRRKTSGGR